MSKPLEDYALIGDCHGAGLVCRDGSIDWLCIPRFDSGACFAALLGSPEHGRWKISPEGQVKTTRRRYRQGSLTLETEFETAEGSVRIVDCMPVESEQVDVVRCVEGLRGRVTMSVELIVRFGNGNIVPWVTQEDGHLHAVAGPDTLHLESPVKLEGRAFRSSASFTVEKGQTVPFVLTYHPSHLPLGKRIDPLKAIEETDRWWRNWSRRAPSDGLHGDAVTRSLITLKAMTYMPTGGLVAAPTTSLPEQIGGTRNWDYRYCWLRDASITLSTLFRAGYEEEARAFREWLLRAVAGEPSQIRVLYDIEGRRDLHEMEADWLPGYDGSRPVRIGNAASTQLQLDIYGELMNTMHQCRRAGLENDASWGLESALLEHLEDKWYEKDRGIWEMRSEPQHFVHSKMMCWVAFDRAVAAVRRFGRPGPAARWAELRDLIFREVCERGYDDDLGAFTQAYGSKRLDASLLMMAPVGFLPITDERVRSTIHVIERELSQDGFVRRYSTESGNDGIVGSEGAFLICSFWLVTNLTLLGEHKRASALFEQLLSIRNDVGLLSEEYDVSRGRLIGNFPQAFSHLALINSAYGLRDSDVNPEREIENGKVG